MARPRVFVSSTYYDLKNLRSSIENFIESLGYDAILSEKGEIAYVPDLPLDVSCYREVKNADIFVIIIGGRYGSEKSDGRKPHAKSFNERYDSITREEYKAALSKDIPIYIHVERQVYSDFETYLQNKDNETIKYAHVDSINIFKLIEDILSQPRGNPIHQFDKYSEIQEWLREQWAGLFRELLNRMSSQAQIAGLATQVNELAEINKTLKTYLEEVVTKVAPDDARKLIESESERLKEAKSLEAIKKNRMVNYLMEKYGLGLSEVITSASEAASLTEFLKKMSTTENRVYEENKIYMNDEPFIAEANRIRESLGLPSFPSPQLDMGGPS